jgi:hypothetical protein
LALSTLRISLICASGYIYGSNHVWLVRSCFIFSFMLIYSWEHWQYIYSLPQYILYFSLIKIRILFPTHQNSEKHRTHWWAPWLSAYFCIFAPLADDHVITSHVTGIISQPFPIISAHLQWFAMIFSDFWWFLPSANVLRSLWTLIWYHMTLQKFYGLVKQLLIVLPRSMTNVFVNFKIVWEMKFDKLPKYLGRWRSSKTRGGHILDQKKRTNNYQDMASVTKSALTKLIL